MTNNNKPIVDLPVFEWLRFSPANTSALTALTTARDGYERYIYYFYGSQLYRYDTYGDTWQTLSVGATPVTALAVQYVKNQGFVGNVLSIPTSTSLQIPSTNSTALVGYKIKIQSGAGAGQVRTITAVAPEVIHDMGLVTTVTTSVVTDTVKRWKQNQWVGYGLKLAFNTGFSQYREILYNDTNSATVYDGNYEGRISSTIPYNAGAPYAAPVATAGAQANFFITSQIITIDSPWTIQPDSSSTFEILSGGIWWLSANASSPFFNFYFYDILSDRWIQKLTPAGMMPAAIGTDFTIEPIADNLYISPVDSTVTSATDKTLYDSSLSLTNGEYNNFYITITGGTGLGQKRRITSNTSNRFSISARWDTIPDNTSQYTIAVKEDVIFEGNARAQMLKYYPVVGVWTSANMLDSGIAINLGITRTNKLPFGISTATRATNGITIINTTPTAGGTNYVYGDILTISTGGSLGRVYVEEINPINGAVTKVSLYTAGNGYTTGAGKATTGGSGTGCTIEITSIGTIGVFTTSINNDIKIGDSVTFSGATEAAWNTTYTVLGIQSAVIFEAAISATTTAVAFYSLGTNLLKDITKNWTPNEFAGKILGVQSNGLTGAITWRKIIGNSANTISFITGTAPTNGNSRYFIQELDAFGKDSSYLSDNQLNYGYATSASRGTIIDTTKAWFPASFNNNKVRLLDTLTGNEVEEIITSSNVNQLNIGRVVAVGQGTNTIAYSNDNGLTWTGVGTSIFSTAGYGVCWNGTRFVAVGAGTNTIAYSNDGINWVGLGVTIFSTQGNAVCWNGTRFIAVGSGTNQIAYSNDGITWAATTNGNTIISTAGNSVAWNGSMFLAGGSGTNILAYSLDGLTWVATTNGNTIFTGGAVRGLSWNGSKWVAAATGTNNKLGYSSDGLTWTGSGNTTFSTAGNAVVWNGTTFVAAGQGTNVLAYSSDGQSWTGVNTTFSTAAYGVSWNGTYFIATGAGTNTLAYSLDGASWTGLGTSIISTQANGSFSTSPFASIYPNIGLIPNSSTKYEIQDSYGMASGTQSTTQLQDLNKKWKVNQWAGKRLLFTSGTGVTQELTITSNTANALTFAVATAPDATTTYTILGRPAIGAGIELLWNFGATANRGKYLISPRGSGSHTFDIYDITKNKWNYGNFIWGQGELLSTGTMYAYDGQNRIYYQAGTTGKVYYYDFVRNEIHTLGTVPYGMSTAILSNRMEIIQTVDGLKYLYLMRHTGQEFWRILINY